MKYIYSLLATLASALVSIHSANAQTGSLSQINNANDLVKRLLYIGDVAIYVLTAFAVAYIVYVIVIYFVKGKDGDESRREAGMHILYGLIGLAIIFSIWGLVNILLNTFGTNNTLPSNRLPNTNFLNTTAGNNLPSNSSSYSTGSYGPN